jgi:hypothetical protein
MGDKVYVKTPEREASAILPVLWGSAAQVVVITPPTSELELALAPVTSSLEGVRG